MVDVLMLMAEPVEAPILEKEAPIPAANLYVPSAPSAYVRGLGEEIRRKTRRHFFVETAHLDSTFRVIEQGAMVHYDQGTGKQVNGGLMRTMRSTIGDRAPRRHINLFR
mmetsp:Transcript_68633/g.183177  ORF Transcript_68633/g.183177 Transcript_68633/m.183177 type:complete len:109 (+) Transcript_68633:124-450(+)